MPFLLMVFLTVACLPGWETNPGWVRSPALSVALTALGVAVVALESCLSARAVRRAGGRDPARRERVAERYERRRFWRQFLLLGVYALSLYACGWGWAVGQLWCWNGDPKAPLFGVKILTLAPYFLALLLSWAFAFDADRALYVAAHRLLTGAPPAAGAAADARRDFGGRGAYVAFQARQKLALVFLPVVLLILQQEVVLQIPPAVQEQWEWPLSLLAVAGVAAVLLSLPWMVRLALGLKPLPPGPLRDRLLAAARRLRFRCTDVLLWDTRGGMANAMVVGVLPWPRYVIFTDRFLEEFNGDETEAVFGHEVGHVKHRHMMLYLGFLMLSLAVAAYACVALSPWAPGLAEGGLTTAALDGLPVSAAWLPAVAGGFLAYVLVVFGFLSRRCERQADVYGCRAVSCGRADCAGHEHGPELPPRTRGLCPTGVRIFIYALEKVALVNGISRERPGFFQSWQHGSIARRVAFLYGLMKDPAAERRFQRRVAVVQWGLLVLLAAALAVLAAVTPAPREETKAAPAEPTQDAPEVVPNARRGADPEGEPVPGRAARRPPAHNEGRAARRPPAGVEGVPRRALFAGATLHRRADAAPLAFGLPAG